MATSSQFWDRVADRYARRPVSDEQAYQEKLRITREYFRPDMKVLEIGCGTGTTALSHAPHVGHIDATDISPRMLEIARQRKADAGVSNITFGESAIEDLEVAASSYDAVLALNILHLVDDWPAAIRKVHQWLKPDGVFVSSTVCVRDMFFGFRLLLPMMQLVRVAPLVRVFGAQAFENTLTDSGFTIEHNWRPSKNAAVFIVARKTRAA